MKLSKGEEQEALLANVDREEDSLSSSNRSGLPSTDTSSPSTTREGQYTSRDEEYDVDPEAAASTPPRIAPDQFIKGYETTKWEIWAYYGYYVGNTGLTLAIFAPMAMQNLMSLAAGENGMLPFLGRYCLRRRLCDCRMLI